MLELVHSDVYDLHNTPTIGGNKYFVTFINDFSRYYYVCLLHSKNKISKKFKIYKSEVKLSCETFIKILELIEEVNIMILVILNSLNLFIYETSTYYTPQQNGVVEQKNKVLTKMVNAMLSNSGLNQDF